MHENNSKKCENAKFHTKQAEVGSDLRRRHRQARSSSRLLKPLKLHHHHLKDHLQSMLILLRRRSRNQNPDLDRPCKLILLQKDLSCPIPKLDHQELRYPWITPKDRGQEGKTVQAASGVKLFVAKLSSEEQSTSFAAVVSGSSNDSFGMI